MTDDARWTNRAKLDETFRAVIGLPLWGSHRAVDLEAFLIGDVHTGIDPKRGPFEAAEDALHVQSPWRITTANRIVVAYRDLRYPKAGVSDSEFDPNELGVTRREALLEQFFAERAGTAAIESFRTSDLGDLRLVLAGGYALEVFPDISSNDEDPEYWRLLKHHGWHVVVSGHGIMLLD